MASAGRLSIGGTGRSCPFVNVAVVRAKIHLGATRQELTHESLDLCVRLSPLGHITFEQQQHCVGVIFVGPEP